MERYKTVITRRAFQAGDFDRALTVLHAEAAIAKAKARELSTRARFIEAIAGRDAEQDSCWLWEGQVSTNGYGAFSAWGKSVRAHRYSYELFVGPIPEGLVIDHLCGERLCVNPRHLEAVTQAVNLERCGAAEAARAAKAARRLCKRGHPLEGENLILSEDGRHRRCRTCIRASAMDGYYRRKGNEK